MLCLCFTSRQFLCDSDNPTVLQPAFVLTSLPTNTFAFFSCMNDILTRACYQICFFIFLHCSIFYIHVLFINGLKRFAHSSHFKTQLVTDSVLVCFYPVWQAPIVLFLPHWLYAMCWFILMDITLTLLCYSSMKTKQKKITMVTQSLRLIKRYEPAHCFHKCGCIDLEGETFLWLSTRARAANSNASVWHDLWHTGWRFLQAETAHRGWRMQCCCWITNCYKVIQDLFSNLNDSAYSSFNCKVHCFLDHFDLVINYLKR